MLIFGWGHTITRNFGQTYFAKCLNCDNESWWVLNSYETWATFFFIPIFPYESKHMLMCEICSHGIELTGSDKIEAKKLNKATTSYLNGEISKDQYRDATFQTRLLEQS